jgi:hypothetical protein
MVDWDLFLLATFWHVILFIIYKATLQSSQYGRFSKQHQEQTTKIPKIDKQHLLNNRRCTPKDVGRRPKKKNIMVVTLQTSDNHIPIR